MPSAFVSREKLLRSIVEPHYAHSTFAFRQAPPSIARNAPRVSSRGDMDQARELIDGEARFATELDQIRDGQSLFHAQGAVVVIVQRVIDGFCSRDFLLHVATMYASRFSASANAKWQLVICQMPKTNCSGLQLERSDCEPSAVNLKLDAVGSAVVATRREIAHNLSLAQL